ncbi:hypothetical protein HFN62_23715 [Rhizobium leguminosarum]|uniref:hypothetical protein n=1 Tax=Rhizobium leguminosarum TaxID=384 RepID=UPI001C949D88|nr:hypothetical protein [Rhizobium leguminosarum]MBY5786721.1 hypothetical protein [Rhizobium leguminosarum]
MNEIANIRDLLEGVDQADARDYLSEAVVCFEVGAFRACIVMTANAVFANLIGRVADFAEFDTQASTLKNRIDSDLSSQRAFEAHMIDELYKAQFLTIHQKVGLVKIRDARNKAAHPSGVKSTPEEAKAVLRTAVEDFIKPVWLTASEGTRRLVRDMHLGAVFPKKGDDAKVVDERLAQIDKTAHAKLIAELWDELANPTHEVFTRDAHRFLIALAGKQDDRFRKQFPRLLASRREALPQKSAGDGGKATGGDHRWLPLLISADPFLFTVMDGTAKTLLDERVASAFIGAPSEEIFGFEAAERLISAVTGSPLRQTIVESYPEAVSAAVNAIGVRAVLFGCLREMDLLRERALAPVYDAWDHGDSALRIAEVLPEIDEALADGISGQRAFDLVVSMCSFSRQMKETALSDLVTLGFSVAPALRRRALDFMEMNPEDAVETLQHHVMCGPKELVETFLTPRRPGSFRKKAAV